MAIGFECEICGREIEVDEEMAGREVTCDGCHNEIRVPIPDIAETAMYVKADYSDKDMKAPAAGEKKKKRRDVVQGEERDHIKDAGTFVICTSCGSDIPKGQTVCLNCGIDLVTGAKLPGYGEKKKILTPKLIALIVVLALIVLFFIGKTFFWGGGDTDDTQVVDPTKKVSYTCDIFPDKKAELNKKEYATWQRNAKADHPRGIVATRIKGREIPAIDFGEGKGWRSEDGMIEAEKVNESLREGICSGCDKSFLLTGLTEYNKFKYCEECYIYESSPWVKDAHDGVKMKLLPDSVPKGEIIERIEGGKKIYLKPENVHIYDLTKLAGSINKRLTPDVILKMWKEGRDKYIVQFRELIDTMEETKLLKKSGIEVILELMALWQDPEDTAIVYSFFEGHPELRLQQDVLGYLATMRDVSVVDKLIEYYVNDPTILGSGQKKLLDKLLDTATLLAFQKPPEDRSALVDTILNYDANEGYRNFKKLASLVDIVGYCRRLDWRKTQDILHLYFIDYDMTGSRITGYKIDPNLRKKLIVIHDPKFAAYLIGILCQSGYDKLTKELNTLLYQYTGNRFVDLARYSTAQFKDAEDDNKKAWRAWRDRALNNTPEGWKKEAAEYFESEYFRLFNKWEEAAKKHKRNEGTPKAKELKIIVDGYARDIASLTTPYLKGNPYMLNPICQRILNPLRTKFISEAKQREFINAFKAITGFRMVSNDPDEQLKEIRAWWAEQKDNPPQYWYYNSIDKEHQKTMRPLLDMCSIDSRGAYAVKDNVNLLPHDSFDGFLRASIKSEHEKWLEKLAGNPDTPPPAYDFWYRWGINWILTCLLNEDGEGLGSFKGRINVIERYRGDLIEELRNRTGMYFGYKPQDPKEFRDKHLQDWVKWWESVGGVYGDWYFNVE